jgi:hypothetical protein
VLSLPIDQQVKHLPRTRSAIYIITQEDLHRVSDRPRVEVIVDPPEQRYQKVGPTVYVTDRVNTFADWGTRFRLFPGG